MPGAFLSVFFGKKIVPSKSKKKNCAALAELTTTVIQTKTINFPTKPPNKWNLKCVILLTSSVTIHSPNPFFCKKDTGMGNF
jgi:hypothetical protein